MPVSDTGIALVKAFEGFEANAYKCPAGVWTIGWGHARGVNKGDTITPADAEELLRKDLARYADAVAPLVNRPLNQNELDALASFAFNLGLKSFADSTLRKYLNEGRSRGDIEEQFGRWRYATVNGKKKEFEGLRRRRAAEAALFFAPLGAKVSVVGQSVMVQDQVAAAAPAGQPNIVWQHAGSAGGGATGPAGPAGPTTRPNEMPQAPTPPPEKPIAASRTIWGGALAGFSGISAWLTEMQTKAGSLQHTVEGVLRKIPLTPQIKAMLPNVFIFVFIAAIVLVLYARLDDQRRRSY